MNRKWTWFHFGASDFKGVEAYLNRQAAKGWELERVGTLFARWRRTERRDLTWCVDLVPPQQSRDERQEYLDLCGEGGWELAAMGGGMYLFKSRPGQRTFPIQTDPELEKRNYKKYFMRSFIPVAIYIVFIIALMIAAGGPNLSAFDGWMESWTVAAMLLAAPVWGVWAVWKTVHFIAAQFRNRRGEIAPPPVPAMWISCVLSGAATLMLLLVGVGMFLGAILNGERIVNIAIYLILFAGAALYHALAMEGEQFPGEKKRSIRAGVLFLALFVLLIVTKLLTPYGEWATSWFAPDDDVGELRYEQSLSRPIVHGEDVGIPFSPIDGETVNVAWKYTPMGEHWALQYYYDEEKNSRGALGLGSSTTLSPFLWQAERLAEALADGKNLNRYAPWPDEGLTEVEIPWADEAWYGRCLYEDSAEVTILVLRVGKTATRLIFPVELMTEENLAAIRGELTK